jgi:hypothetical protein
MYEGRGTREGRGRKEGGGTGGKRGRKQNDIPNIHKKLFFKLSQEELPDTKVDLFVSQPPHHRGDITGFLVVPAEEIEDLVFTRKLDFCEFFSFGEALERVSKGGWRREEGKQGRGRRERRARRWTS